MKRSFFVFLTCILIILSVPMNSSAEVEVTIYSDTQSAGWAYKTSDFAFVAEEDGCRIQWNAIEGKDGEKSLEVKRNCQKPFAGQVKLHRAILRKINRKWPLNSFQYINWGTLCNLDDWAWCQPVARASLQSADFIDYWKNYPASKLKEVNTLFVRLANQSNSYAPLARLFHEFQVTIELGNVEKVFSARLNKSPFASDFQESAPPGNPRVMYNVGMAYFHIMK